MTTPSVCTLKPRSPGCAASLPSRPAAARPTATTDSTAAATAKPTAPRAGSSWPHVQRPRQQGLPRPTHPTRQAETVHHAMPKAVRRPRALPTTAATTTAVDTMRSIPILCRSKNRPHAYPVPSAAPGVQGIPASSMPAGRNDATGRQLSHWWMARRYPPSRRSASRADVAHPDGWLAKPEVSPPFVRHEDSFQQRSSGGNRISMTGLISRCAPSVCKSASGLRLVASLGPFGATREPGPVRH